MARTTVTALMLVTLATLPAACATKKYVTTTVDEVNQRVDAVQRTLEDTQAQTRKNAARIDPASALRSTPRIS